MGRSEEGAQGAFDDGALEVGDDHVLGAEVVVGDAAGLDDDEIVFAGNAAGVAESEEDQTAADEFEVGLQDLFAEVVKVHGRVSILL